MINELQRITSIKWIEVWQWHIELFGKSSKSTLDISSVGPYCYIS